MNDPIRLSGVNKVYPDGIVAVRDCTLHVPAGQTHAILGPNGAEKTTTIRMIHGLAKPSGGQVRVFGRDTLMPMRVFAWGRCCRSPSCPRA